MVKNDIEQLLIPVIEDLGYELWGCEYIPQGKHSLLRLYIDKSDGIHIDDCQRVSKQVSAILTVEDPIPGHYTLEVSSPGINRTLFYPKQYERYLGYEIDIKLTTPLAANNRSRRLKGYLGEVNTQGICVKTNEESFIIPFNQISKAHLTGE